MVVDEDVAGKGMDGMSKWQQHYYTWSTNSLSQNKVGLGIVAASLEDRESLRLAEHYGAKSEGIRDGSKITIERGLYSPELSGFVRTGATPCEQGADQRNNVFVHIYSAKDHKLSYPEIYLGKLDFKTQWEGEKSLPECSMTERKEGRAYAIALLKKMQMTDRLEELFYLLYHCLLAGESPLTVKNQRIKLEEFGEFSREMMIIIHYMLPLKLRKEADYVSFQTENKQEAHIQFGNEQGKYLFDCQFAGKPKHYAMLEQAFYHMLTDAFLQKENDAFEKIMEQMDHFLMEITDQRNLLEKCIFSFMASQAGREKQTEEFFYSLERLMYWAKKETGLIPAIQMATKDLDFASMKEGELLSYTKLMVTGAGGQTKDMAYGELNRMLCYYHEKKDGNFAKLLEQIYKKNPSVYEKILLMNRTGFTKTVLKEPIDSKEKLEQIVRCYSEFLKADTYKNQVMDQAYELYRQTKTEALREEISSLAKKVSEEEFLLRKLQDVEQVLKTAETLEDYFAITEQMAVEKMEPSIQKQIAVYGMSHVKMKSTLSLEEEQGILHLGQRLSLSSYVEQELSKHYQKQIILKLDQMGLPALFRELSGKEVSHETKLYHRMKLVLMAKRYLFLIKEEPNPDKLDIKKWISFVLKLSRELETIDQKKGKDMIQATKASVLKTENLYFLAEVNHMLHNYGENGIHCPKEMWDRLPLDTLDDFKLLYGKILDLSYVKCQKSAKYIMAKKLYELAENTREKEKAEYAWNTYEMLEKKARRQKMEERGWKKLVHCALEDVMSLSIWAVVLGLYGYLFVMIRENTKSPTEYWYSIGVLVVLVLCYGLFTLVHQKKEMTPGGILYVLGVGIFLMNVALSLDTVMSIVILFALSVVLSLGMKIFSAMYMEE